MKQHREAAISTVFVVFAAAAGCYIVAATVRQLALAAHARLSVAIGALLFGAIVGGPFSWVIRDLTRAIERRANF